MNFHSNYYKLTCNMYNFHANCLLKSLKPDPAVPKSRHHKCVSCITHTIHHAIVIFMKGTFFCDFAIAS